MTADLTALLEALGRGDADEATALVLADALEEAGRDEEAALLRGGANVTVSDDGRVLDADLRTYRAYCEAGGDTDLDAADMDEALELAREWVSDGEWGDGGAAIGCRVCEYDAAGEETDWRDITVEVEPNHAALIAEACGGRWGGRSERCCGTDPDDHDWTSEGEGGCDENPGVWSTGGTSMSFASHCRACGLHRSEDTTGSQRNPGEHDTVRYEMPETWCAECEAEVCRCRPTRYVGEWGHGDARGAGKIVCRPGDYDAVKAAYDAIEDGDLGPDVLADVEAAGGVFVPE